MRTVPVAVMLTFALLSACSHDADAPKSGPASTSQVTGTFDSAPSSVPTSSVTTTVATTTSAVTAASTLGWDGATFDIGKIVAVESDDVGLILVFDRWGFDDGSGGSPKSGPRLTEEPIVTFNTDSPWTNESTRPRRFRVAALAEYLVMDRTPLVTACDGVSIVPEPSWASRPIASIRNFLGSDDADGAQTSLTYDAAGLVQRIRVSYGC